MWWPAHNKLAQGNSNDEPAPSLLLLSRPPVWTHTHERRRTQRRNSYPQFGVCPLGLLTPALATTTRGQRRDHLTQPLPEMSLGRACPIPGRNREASGKPRTGEVRSGVEGALQLQLLGPPPIKGESTKQTKPLTPPRLPPTLTPTQEGDALCGNHPARHRTKKSRACRSGSSPPQQHSLHHHHHPLDLS